MKRLIVFSIMALLFTTYSCNSLKHIKFDADFRADATMRAQQTANTTDTLIASQITTNIASLVQSNNTRTDLLTTVKLRNLNFTINSPAGKTLSFLQEVRVLISTDTQGEREIAVKRNVTSSGSSFDCDLGDVEL